MKELGITSESTIFLVGRVLGGDDEDEDEWQDLGCLNFTVVTYDGRRVVCEPQAIPKNVKDLKDYVASKVNCLPNCRSFDLIY